MITTDFLINLFLMLSALITIKTFFYSEYKLSDLYYDIVCCIVLLNFKFHLISAIFSCFVIKFWFDIIFKNMYLKDKILIKTRVVHK